jgi:hypothetical protein
MSTPEAGSATWSGPITLAQSLEWLPREPYAVLTEHYPTGQIDLTVAGGPKLNYDWASMSCLASPPIDEDPSKGPHPEQLVIMNNYGLGEALWIDEPTLNVLHQFWERYQIEAEYRNILTARHVGFAAVKQGEVGFKLDGFDYAVTHKGIVTGSLIAAVRRLLWRKGLTEVVNQGYTAGAQEQGGSDQGTGV